MKTDLPALFMLPRLPLLLFGRARVRCSVSERDENGGVRSLEPEARFLCSTGEGQLNRLSPSLYVTGVLLSIGMLLPENEAAVGLAKG